jgi:hypothetical protein
MPFCSGEKDLNLSALPFISRPGALSRRVLLGPRKIDGRVEKHLGLCIDILELETKSTSPIPPQNVTNSRPTEPQEQYVAHVYTPRELGGREIEEIVRKHLSNPPSQAAEPGLKCGCG